MSLEPRQLPPDASGPRRDVFDSLSPFHPLSGNGLSEIRLPPRPRNRVWLHVTLFVMTLVTTTSWGMYWYFHFTPDPGSMTWMSLVLSGFWYSGTVLAILGCHELGHYAACRYYGIDASLPYFLPAPVLTGTVGAFIRIREPIRQKRVLFDIGVAGPLAGFVVAVPALWIGVSLSRIAPIQPDVGGLILGDPLLFKAFAWLIWGSPGEGLTVVMHPMGFAAWFGLLATALNLFPVGQLDGGHISYAVLGRWSTVVTLIAVLVAIVLALFSISLIIWTALLVLMILLFGARHPRTEDEAEFIGRGRLAVAVLAMVIFVVCFTPRPIELPELMGR